MENHRCLFCYQARFGISPHFRGWGLCFQGFSPIIKEQTNHLFNFYFLDSSSAGISIYSYSLKVQLYFFVKNRIGD